LEFVWITTGTTAPSSQWVTPDGGGGGASGGATSPGGLDTYVQYNSTGSFGGDANFVYNYSTGVVTITGGITVNDTGIVGPIVNLNTQNRELYANDGSTLAIGYSDPQKIESSNYFNSTKAISLQESVSASFWYSGDVIVPGKFNVSVLLYDVVYLNNSTGEWTTVDQSASTSTNLLGICLSIDPDLVLLEGHIVVSNNNTGAPGVDSLTGLGVPIYLMERISTDPYMTTVVPTTGYVRILGYPYYRNVVNTNYYLMKFKPDNTWVQI
jgi:hypothetical protein